MNLIFHHKLEPFAYVEIKGNIANRQVYVVHDGGIYLKVWVLALSAILAILPYAVDHAWAVSTVTWDFANHALSDGRADAVGIPLPGYTVTDDTFLGDGRIDVIQVKVNSTSDPAGIVQNLTESGPGSGTFYNTGVVFSNGTGLIGISSSQTVGVHYPALAGTGEIICHSFACPNSIDVFSTTDPVGIVMNLTETGHNTGVFTNTLHFTTGPSVPGSSISVHDGDIVTIHDISNDDATNEIVTPNPDPSLGAIPSIFGDTVCAIYNGVEGCTLLNGGSAPGGGGGGLIRPGSVVLGLLGAGGKDPGIFDAPSIGNDYYYRFGNGVSINGKSFSIENYSTIIPQQVLKIGTPANFGFKIFDERGPYTISDVVMYFHFKGDPSPENADTWVSWDRARGEIAHDPNNIFAKTAVKTSINGSFLYANFTMIPQKPMPDSSLIMRMWDDKLAMGDVPIWGAIVIVDPNAKIPVKKIPTDQFGDYVMLERILDKDGYDIPTLLNKLHSMPDIYTSVDINWVYDKGVDKLAMVESDKSGNLMGTIVCNLTKKISQPSVTDHDFFTFTTTQLNRQDASQEDAAKLVEAQKAEKLLGELGLLRQNNFEEVR